MGRTLDALRRRLRGGPALRSLAVFEEIYVPTRYESVREQEQQVELPAPAPAPGDPERLGRRDTTHPA